MRMKAVTLCLLAAIVVGLSGCASLGKNWVKVRDRLVETTFETTAGLVSKVAEETFKAAATITTDTLGAASSVFDSEDSEQ